MLCRTILAVLIASTSISRIQAKEIGERRAQLNKTPVNEVNTVIGALAIQENNTFYTGPNDDSIYGSIVKVNNNIYESPDSRHPTSTQTRTVIAPGGPGYDGVYYAKLEERNQQGQPENKLSATTYMKGNTFDISPGTNFHFGSFIEENNNVYRSRGGNNQTQPNEKHTFSNGLTAVSVLTNNHIRTSGNMTINVGSQITRNGNVYTPDKNSQTGENTINGTERQDNLTAAINEILSIARARPEEQDKRENRVYFRNRWNTHQDPTERKRKSSIYDSDPRIQTEQNAQDSKEKEAYAVKRIGPNGQTSLSPNVFYSFTYFLIILIKLSVLN